MNKLLFIIIIYLFVTKKKIDCKYETKTTISWWQITEWVIHPTNQYVQMADSFRKEASD